MASVINVGISDLNVANPPDVLATYALGSCVGICLLDNNRKIGGLAHIMLPNSKEAANASVNLRRYADTGISELISQMQKKGAVLVSVCVSEGIRLHLSKHAFCFILFAVFMFRNA